ncbi:putative O-methyltransferase YrrM [Ulvibacter sp. MAR_2010_11]|uniref:O-methyltransferase n=1 Tax=Ulvibacter sp. MAR_2010_11 TaxID=1250229 RepID=UPI000C2C1EC5|nr:class I SAM-dependent methyltransferase [Ulvibacter sp. MAR_2010_11]PKA82149.1 putative O-methyltransferase YrrM [Ulvibacter sp. MAR_2010_11]
MHQLKSYIKFLARSTNQHGVHSPFVYNLVTKCFYDSTVYPEYKILKNFRKQLLKSSETIEVTDFGAGSRVFKSNTRKVSHIAKHAGISVKRQQLLFRLVRYFKAEKCLELGTSLGLATAAMALGNPSVKVQTVEGCPNTGKTVKRFFDDFSMNNIEMHTVTFDTFFTEIHSEKYDLIFIDGNHDKAKTLEYFENLLKFVANNSVLVFDDIYWSAAMTEAWQEIIQHPKVTVSIDTFYWGIVFFRKEQRKEHFTIRL